MIKKADFEAPSNVKAAAARGFMRTFSILTGRTMEKAATAFRKVRTVADAALDRQVKVANVCLEKLAEQPAPKA